MIGARDPKRVALLLACVCGTIAAAQRAGAQTRSFHFDPAPAPPPRPTPQGHSVAAWQDRGLKVRTTSMTAGYLRKNGVPYSEKAALTEYLDLMPPQPNGDRWLVLSSIV